MEIITGYGRNIPVKKNIQYIHINI